MIETASRNSYEIARRLCFSDLVSLYVLFSDETRGEIARILSNLVQVELEEDFFDLSEEELAEFWRNISSIKEG